MLFALGKRKQYLYLCFASSLQGRKDKIVMFMVGGEGKTVERSLQ